MPLSQKYQAIFVHIPKNAGESIEVTLEMYRGDSEETLWGVKEKRVVLQHLSAEKLKNQYIEKSVWETFLKFSVVRNPWSKAVSEYYWYLRFGPLISFPEWVDSLPVRLQINEMINILEIGHNVRQYEFLYDKNGRLLVDRILKFEDLSSGFKSLCDERNWQVSLKYDKATKSSPSKDYRSFYNEVTAKKILNIYRKDVELFGYSMHKTFENYDLK